MKKHILLCIFIFSTSAVLGQQGNYKYNNYGNRSIILSGNVTGSVTDMGLTYYNPARLKRIRF